MISINWIYDQKQTCHVGTSCEMLCTKSNPFAQYVCDKRQFMQCNFVTKRHEVSGILKCLWNTKS